MISIKILPPYFVIFGICLVLLNFNVCLGYVTHPLCWAYNLVPYKIKPGFSNYQRNYIRQEIAKINKLTCLYWRDMTDLENAQNLSRFVSFEKTTERKCETAVHYPKKAEITLADDCFRRGDIVLHEIVHALGFRHEQERIDRNCYIWVSEAAKDNPNLKISPEWSIFNMDKFPYDKLSIMHYSRSNQMKALTERFYEWEPLGTDEGELTDLDLWKIQYRFCGRPHYCEVYPDHCRDMDQMEADMKCIAEQELSNEV